MRGCAAHCFFSMCPAFVPAKVLPERCFEYSSSILFFPARCAPIWAGTLTMRAPELILIPGGWPGRKSSILGGRLDPKTGRFPAWPAPVDKDKCWCSHTAADTTTRSTFKIEDPSLGPGRVDFRGPEEGFDLEGTPKPKIQRDPLPQKRNLICGTPL